MTLLRRFMRSGAAGIALFFLLSVTGIAWGQQDDPSDIFLKAYLSAQQGEKLEHQNRFKTALAKYRFAGSLIEELRKSHADWQPAVVEYRGRKVSEGILRLQERMTRQTQLNASASPLPEIAPVAPESDAWSEPGPEVVAPQVTETVSEMSRDAAIKDGTKKIRDKVNQLQAALDKTRGDLQTAHNEKEVVDRHLKETDSKLQRAQNELDDAKKSESEARQQLTQVHESLSTSKASEANRDTEQEQLRKEIAELKQAVVAADQARVTAEKQRDDTQAKFAEANNQQQMAPLQQLLTDSQNSNHYLAARAAELDVELERAGAELQAAKLAVANGEESVQLARENELLRNIVVRERQEEARRDEARKLVLAELDRLNVRSDVLNKQIEFLAQPVTKLTSEELALFRQPVVSISDEKPGVFKASFVFEKQSPTSSIITAKADKPATTAQKVVSDDLQKITRTAHKNVEQGKYRTAEKQYQEILATDPNNLDALSNLGALYFRIGRIRSAESTLRKALALAPNDDFALTTLGIVHYRQSRFDDALMELRKAIEINPNSATAHNYLGITASQKGRQEEAEKEILQAIAKNPNYADAHFNLAVILITTQPASKELAREHYARATALGTQPSPPLEQLLK